MLFIFQFIHFLRGKIGSAHHRNVLILHNPKTQRDLSTVSHPTHPRITQMPLDSLFPLNPPLYSARIGNYGCASTIPERKWTKPYTYTRAWYPEFSESPLDCRRCPCNLNARPIRRRVNSRVIYDRGCGERRLTSRREYAIGRFFVDWREREREIEAWSTTMTVRSSIRLRCVVSSVRLFLQLTRFFFLFLAGSRYRAPGGGCN